MEQTTVGPADVKLTGGTYVKGAKLTLAKLTFLGKSPNATVKVFDYDETNRRFREYDRLTNATVTDGKTRGSFTVTGTSEQATEDIVGADESDLIVTWDVKVTGACSDCG